MHKKIRYLSKHYLNDNRPLIPVGWISLTGLTYLEILVGIAIISFILVGMNSIFGIGIRNTRKAENIHIALGLAQELMEEIKGKDFSDIDSIGETNINRFMRKADVISSYQGNEDKKLVTVTVSGPDITDVELNCIIADPTLV